MNTRLYFWPGLLLLATSACVGTADYSRLRSELYAEQQARQKLETRVQHMEANVAPAQANTWAEVESLRRQVATLSGQMDSLQRQGSMAPGLSPAELDARIAQLEKQVQTLASQMGIELTGTRIGAPTQATPQGSTAQERRPAPLPPTQTPPSSTSAPATSAEGAGAALYQQGLDAFYARDYAKAQQLWANFVQTNPKDPLVPNALFWQGESYFQMGEFAKAVLAYQEVIEKYPNSTKLRAAMLKQGMAFLKLKKTQAGKLVLQDLVKKYPNTPEAKRAQDVLSGK
jgi:tol-pal system protein YbgF